MYEENSLYHIVSSGKSPTSKAQICGGLGVYMKRKISNFLGRIRGRHVTAGVHRTFIHTTSDLGDGSRWKERQGERRAMSSKSPRSIQ